jgi:hypothetical protein
MRGLFIGWSRGGQTGEDMLQLVSVGSRLEGTILGTAHLGCGHQLEGVGDLGRVADAGDAAFELSNRCHEGLFPELMAASRRPGVAASG